MTATTEMEKSNRETASLFSRVTFTWVRPFLKRAHEKTRLEHEDLVPLPEKLSCATNAERFEFELRDCLEKEEREEGTSSLGATRGEEEKE